MRLEQVRVEQVEAVQRYLPVLRRGRQVPATALLRKLVSVTRVQSSAYVPPQSS